MYRNILIPTDGSELAEKAVAHGLRLAKAVGAKVTGVTVSEPFPHYAAPNDIDLNAPDSTAQVPPSVKPVTVSFTSVPERPM